MCKGERQIWNNGVILVRMPLQKIDSSYAYAGRTVQVVKDIPHSSLATKYGKRLLRAAFNQSYLV